MKLIKTDLIYDLLEDPTISEEAREFFEYLLNNPEEIEKTNKFLEEHEFVSKVGEVLANFIEELGKEEEEFKEVLKDIQEKMELHTSKSKGEA